MTTTLQPIPSKPPAAAGNLGAILQWCFTKLLQKTDGQLPAQVVSYNRATNMAKVQPLISIISTAGKRVARAPVANVPVLALGGGGFFCNFPLGPNDRGWIEASDRDISLYLQTAQLSPPNTKRLHSFEDARFIPDVFDQYTFAPTAGAMVISSYDGTTRIELSQGVVNVYAPTINEQCETYNVNASQAINLNTAALNIATTGAGSTVTGPVNLPAQTTIAGVLFPTHEHSGVMTGTGDTGPVVGAT